jgi:CDP-diacylglycerol--glycerol-3-phosphate 3-phosphatidyltransferase
VHVPWNPANLLSFGRLIATVPLVVLVLMATPMSLLASAILFVVMAITDTVDGRLARRYGWVSNVGIFHPCSIRMGHSGQWRSFSASAIG